MKFHGVYNIYAKTSMKSQPICSDHTEAMVRKNQLVATQLFSKSLSVWFTLMYTIAQACNDTTEQMINKVENNGDN
jgi:hypothetical protein